MIKKYYLTTMIAAIAILGFVTGACNKMESVNEAPFKSVSVVGTKAAGDLNFGLTEWDFIAGNPKNGATVAGKISMWNDYDNVYVKFATVDDWYMSQTHLYIGPKEILLTEYVNPQGSLAPGQLPYQASFDAPATEWVYALPLVDLYAMYGLTPETVGDLCPVIAAHANVFEMDEEGNIFNTNSACGNGTQFVEEHGNWFMYSEGYCVEFPPEDPEEPTYEFQEETAWAFDVDNPLAYNTKKGNWAKFIQYNGEPLTVILLAGKKETEMTVTLTPAGDKVQMVFEGIAEIAPENDGKWVLQDVSDAIKIQGYETAPSGNPAPGQFSYYKGRDMAIEVDAANYYGIHLDVAKLTVVYPE